MPSKRWTCLSTLGKKPSTYRLPRRHKAPLTSSLPIQEPLHLLPSRRVRRLHPLPTNQPARGKTPPRQRQRPGLPVGLPANRARRRRCRRRRLRHARAHADPVAGAAAEPSGSGHRHRHQYRHHHNRRTGRGRGQRRAQVGSGEALRGDHGVLEPEPGRGPGRRRGRRRRGRRGDHLRGGLRGGRGVQRRRVCRGAGRRPAAGDAGQLGVDHGGERARVL